MKEIEIIIGDKCASREEAKDFTDEEKEYIRVHQTSLFWLFRWFESSLSDDCWTENNYQFMSSFYPETTRIYRLCTE